MKQKLYLGFIALSINSIAQQAPTGFGVNGTGANASTYWARGGSLQMNPPGNNIFGTLWNSPIYTQTMGKTRMAINGDKTANIAGYAGQVTDGFVGIGADNVTQGNPFSTIGPISLLHLNSGVGNFVQQVGWRP